MTVLGNNPTEKVDDKEKLVKEDVATILPTRIRLIHARKTRLITKLVVSISILFIILIGIFLTVCYIRKIGPFERKIRGQCGVGDKRFNHHRLFESYEITDHYTLINVPRFNYYRNHFESVKTLHIHKLGLTVMQNKGMCFLKNMRMKTHRLHGDWFRMLINMKKKHQHMSAPYRYSYYHYRIQQPPLTNKYLRDKVHHMAAAMCHRRPVFQLTIFHHPIPSSTRRHKCKRPCPKMCPKYRRLYRWVTTSSGIRCQQCRCGKSIVPFLRRQKLGSFNHEKITTAATLTTKINANNNANANNNNNNDTAAENANNCKTIRCDRKCDDKNKQKCIHCRCIEHESTPSLIRSKKDLKKVVPIPIDINIEPIPITENDGSKVEEFQDKSKQIAVNANTEDPKVEEFQDKSKQIAVNANTESPKVEEFQDRSRQIAINGNGIVRSKRSTKEHCKLIAQFFEGYTPLDASDAAVDYIHDC